MMLEDYCVIDLEMTGLNPKHHKILEVAVVRVRKKEIVSECSMLIRQHQLLEEKITELTGIDQEMLAGAKEEDEVLDHYGIEIGHHHRALDDAKATYLLYERLEKEFGAVQADVFEPKPLIYKAKRQTPATARQKKHLKELADYHKINLNLEWETLTRNEASRQVDRIISQYGRMLK